MKNLLPLILVLPMFGCSMPSGVRDDSRASLDSSYLYEVIDPLEELKAEIKEFPNSFDVPLEDVNSGTERAAMFFKELLGSTDLSIGQNTVNGQKIIQGSSSNYKYIVTTRNNGTKVRYLVQCMPIKNGSLDQADLNARNLSRFIRDGQLEKMLLVR